MALPAWNTRAFGCLLRDPSEFRSLLRTQLSASLPSPFLSRAADSSAPLELSFALEMTDGGFASWIQWTTYDLYDGSSAFTMYLPWGTQQPRVRARLLGAWNALRTANSTWEVSGAMEIERASLPRFSGGAL